MPCSSFYSKRKKAAEIINVVSLPDGNISEDDLDGDPGGQGSLIDFLVDICRSLLASKPSQCGNDSESNEPVRRQRSLKGSQVPNAVRYDKYNHWPIQCEKPQRCKADGCARRTRFLCSKCQVYLCTNGSKCFVDYHGVFVT